MKKKMKISMAVLAGASAVVGVQQANAALTIVPVLKTASQVGGNGTYDVIDFEYTGNTGVDTQTGSSGQAAGVLLLQGTFTATGSVGTPMLGVPGASSTDQGGTSATGYFGKYITGTEGVPPTSTSTHIPAGDHVSLVNLPTLASNPSRSGSGTATYVANTGTSVTPLTISGNSGSLTGSWFSTTALTPKASGTHVLAEMLVTPGDGVSFTGVYTTYGSNSAPITFSFATSSSTTNTNKIISLTPASGGAPAGYGVALTNGSGANQATFNPNAPTQNAINVTGANSSYVPGFANGIQGASGPGAITDSVKSAGFTSGDLEVYALKLNVGTSRPTAAQDSQIATAIAANSTGVSASVVSGIYASEFPGYDILLQGSPADTGGFLGFDFSQETAVPGVSVTDIAAVPEPATAAGVLIGAAGLLLGRRKRSVTKA